MTEFNAGLASQQCNDLSAEDSALNYDQASTLLTKLDPQWHTIDNRAISFNYSFKNYYPDLQVSYNRCTVKYNTHSVDGLSINDFICAAKINTAQKL